VQTPERRDSRILITSGRGISKARRVRMDQPLISCLEVSSHCLIFLLEKHVFC
jgi:hypothetical protein